MKPMILLLVLLCLVHPALALEDGLYRDQAEGFGGHVIVTVAVRGGRMEEITTENTGGEKSEYYIRAEEALIPAILEKQSLDGVDAVAGATGTSQSILAAMRGVLEQARYTGAPLEGLEQFTQNAADSVQNAIDGAKDDVENMVKNADGV